MGGAGRTRLRRSPRVVVPVIGSLGLSFCGDGAEPLRWLFADVLHGRRSRQTSDTRWVVERRETRRLDAPDLDRGMQWHWQWQRQQRQTRLRHPNPHRRGSMVLFSVVVDAVHVSGSHDDQIRGCRVWAQESKAQALDADWWAPGAALPPRSLRCSASASSSKSHRYHRRAPLPHPRHRPPSLAPFGCAPGDAACTQRLATRRRRLPCSCRRPPSVRPLLDKPL
jgi:hypothetical protein